MPNNKAQETARLSALLKDLVKQREALTGTLLSTAALEGHKKMLDLGSTDPAMLAALAADKKAKKQLKEWNLQISDIEGQLTPPAAEEKQEAKAPASTLGEALDKKATTPQGPGPKPTGDPGEGMEWRVIDTGSWRGPRWLKRPKKKNEQEASHNPGKHSNLASAMKRNSSYA